MEQLNPKNNGMDENPNDSFVGDSMKSLQTNTTSSMNEDSNDFNQDPQHLGMKSLQTNTMSSTNEDEGAEGESLLELVRSVVDDWISDLSFYVRTPSLESRYHRERLTDLLSERLRSRLSDVRDLELERLRAENDELRQEVEAFESTGYESLKNDLRHKENVIKHLLYLYNDGETLSVEKDRIAAMQDVDLGFADQGDSIQIITEEDLD